MAAINILETNYTILDTREKITVADSFVLPQNKIMTGNGEAKLYVGNDNEEVRNFFGPAGFDIRCFLLKADLRDYLAETKAEYTSPQQPYRNIDQLPEYWQKRSVKVAGLADILWFNLRDQTQIAGPRVYVKSDQQPYRLIRELSLPFITYLSAMKLQGPNSEVIFYFRLFVDYFGETEHPVVVEQAEEAIQDEPISEKRKVQLVAARSGQGKYRRQLLEESPFCPITLVSDDRLLIASHIKPWVASTDREKIDPKNGFMLTPTYDFLFDRGFISFTDDKRLLISPWLSNTTCSRLNISPNKLFPMLPVEGRERYLDYHRAHIFKS